MLQTSPIRYDWGLLIVFTHFASGRLFFFRLAFIVELLALAETKLQLYSGTSKIHRERYGAKSFFFDLGVQLVNLLRM